MNYDLMRQHHNSKAMFFVDYILPWLFLAAFMAGVFIAGNYLIHAWELLSGPLAPHLQ